MNETPTCPKHKVEMKKIYGRYGYFWGCTKFPKCKITINIHDDDVKEYKIATDNTINMLYILFSRGYFNETWNTFIHSPSFKYVEQQAVCEDNPTYRTKYLKKAIKLIREQTTISEFANSSTFSAVLDFLNEKNKFIYIGIWCYFIYLLNGNIPSKCDYWLKTRKSSSSFFRLKEWRLKKAIEQHDFFLNPFFEYIGIRILNFEFIINDYGIVDIYSQHSLFRYPIAIELKSTTHHSGIDQILRYQLGLKRMFQADKTAGYIIGPGYPRKLLNSNEVFYKSIGLISYIVENNEILLIPWRIGEPI